MLPNVSSQKGFFFPLIIHIHLIRHRKKNNFMSKSPHRANNKFSIVSLPQLFPDCISLGVVKLVIILTIQKTKLSEIL